MSPIAIAVAFASALSFGFKVYIALTTVGTNDVLYWQTFVATAKQHGGTAVYHQVWFFNHPPFMIHVLHVLDLLARITGLGFPFWLRTPAIFADVGSIVLVWKILKLDNRRTFKPATLLLMALAPTSVMVSGFHGNTDPVMIFFVLLSIYVIERQNSRKWGFWVAGVAMGMSMNIKVVPIIFLPAMLLYLPSLRARAEFFAAMTGAIVVASFPYILQDPVYILRRVLGYGSLYGQWGLSRLLSSSLPQDLRWINSFYADYGKFGIAAAIVVAAIGMNWVAKRPPLFMQLGLIVFIFLSFSPGFGIQYLAWLVPWVVPLGIVVTSAYYSASGLFQFLVYTFWSGGFPWYLADSDRVGRWRGPLVHYEVICWAATLGVTLVYLTSLASNYGSRRNRAYDHLAQDSVNKPPFVE